MNPLNQSNKKNILTEESNKDLTNTEDDTHARSDDGFKLDTTFLGVKFLFTRLSLVFFPTPNSLIISLNFNLLIINFTQHL